MAKATQSAYGVNTGFTPIVQPVVQTRDPTNLDVNYPLFQQWWNKTAQTLWILNSFNSSSGTILANWEISSSDAIATSYATNSGSAVPVANTLTIAGTSAQGVSTSGSGSTVTITNADWTTSQKGVGTLATNAETIAGSVTNKAVTPDDLKAKLGVQTANGIPYGAGNSSAISWLGAATNGQIPIGSTGSAPVLGNITSTGGSLTITNGAGTINIDFTTPLTVAKGGTGVGTLTSHGVVIGQGTSNVSVTSAGVNNSIFMGNTGADPAFTTSGTPYVTGISFDSGSTTLSNYSSSTFTPALAFGGASTGITYSLQYAKYWRIGSIVFISVRISLSSKGSSTGTATITGLPFSASNDNGISFFPMSAGLITLGANYTSHFAYTNANSSVINMQETGNNVADVNLTDANFSNGSSLSFSGMYFIA